MYTVGFVFAIAILFLMANWLNNERKITKFVEKCYPPDIFSRKDIKHKRTLLKRMNRTFTLHFNFIKRKGKDFLRWSSPFFTRAEGFEVYKDQNIHDAALAKIKQLLHIKYSLKKGVSFYSDRISKLSFTLALLERESELYGYEEYFPYIYQKRIHHLQTLLKIAISAKKNLEDKIAKCDEFIHTLSLERKPTFVDYIIDFITAPISRVFNMIEGFITGDINKVLKSGSLLTISLTGAGLVADALDVLDAIDPFNSLDSIDFVHVDPHEVSGYFRDDGTYVDPYWRDGDHNPLTTLTKEEGGGYYRRV
ncbi:hypothetical protein [Brevibacillus borstelensis]|uniref:hypothetical protein n=1 Tax=Brevibacillus TaxID=55080 RepID=UPI0030FC6B62